MKLREKILKNIFGMIKKLNDSIFNWINPITGINFILYSMYYTLKSFPRGFMYYFRKKDGFIMNTFFRFFGHTRYYVKCRSEISFVNAIYNSGWYTLNLEEPGVIFDIGANVGIYSVYAAKRFSSVQVHAFEPSPYNLQSLRLNIAMNDLQNVLVVPLGVGKHKDTLPFYISSESFCNSFERSAVQKMVEEVKVDIIDLDSYVQEKNVSKVDLVKIDVEDSEYSVLQGMTDVMARDKPIILLPDVKPCSPNYEEIRSLLLEHNYNLSSKIGVRLMALP